MTPEPYSVFDPTLDLELRREVDVPPHLVWRAWTEPELLMKWFTPAPWRTTACELDLRPGGKFRTVMEGPNGEKNDSTGCVSTSFRTGCLSSPMRSARASAPPVVPS